VVANILNLFRDGAVGFIDGYADGVTGHDVTMVSFVVYSEFSISFQRPFSLRTMSRQTTDAVPGLDVASASVSISQRMA
jgi:hypothetical protein